MRSTAAFLTAVLLFLCTACAAGKQPVRREKTYLDLFDTVIQITGYEDSAAEFDRVCDRIYALCAEYHALCDIYQDHGVTGVGALNETAAVKPVKVDRKLFDLLAFGKEMTLKTDGAFNIAFGSVLSLWHEAQKQGVLPEQQALLDAAKHTDVRDLMLDQAGQTVYFADPALKLDLGAIAKGYAAERAYDLLHELGKQDGYLLNFGGNVRALGAKPDGSEWMTGIENPKGEGYVRTFGICDVAVVTSGDSKRGFFVGGVWYHHIIDPKTLAPARYFSQVSVTCSDSGVADALSTALFCMEKEKGELLLEQFDAAADWVDLRGTVMG